jgi:polyisoprenoid-binding protein YceI
MRSLLLTAALLFSTAAMAEDFAVDPVHTRVMVGVEHAGFSHALGTLSGTTGRVQFEDGWAGARVDVTLPIESLDFGDAGWNRAVHGLLDTAREPRARFVSDSVTPRDATHAQVCGRFTLHGVTRPLCMDATLNALRRHPMPPFRRTAGFSATARLDRFDYGITSWPTVIGRDVEIRIELEASRGIGAPKTNPTDEDATP